MNSCEYNLGSILRAAVDLSRSEARPTLSLIQAKTGLTTDQITAALEFEPNPLGWHLESMDLQPTETRFIVRGQPYTHLTINRFTSAPARMAWRS